MESDTKKEILRLLEEAVKIVSEHDDKLWLREYDGMWD